MFRFNHRRTIACLLMPLCGAQMTACRSWQPRMQMTDIAAGSDVRLTRRDGSRVMMRGATVRGDTVHGDARRSGGRTGRSIVSVPVSDVQNLEVHRFSKERTIGLGLGIATGLLLLAFAADNAMKGGPVFGPGY